MVIEDLYLFRHERFITASRLPEKQDMFRVLTQISQDFVNFCSTYGKLIILEVFFLIFA